MRSLLILLMLAAPVAADHCRNRVVVQDVPVFVPVAAPIVFYSIGGQYQPPQLHAQAAQQPLAQGVDDEYAEFLQWKANRVKAASVPQSLFQRTCVSCHGPAANNTLARSALHTDVVTIESKLAMIAAVENDHMPPGAKKNPLPEADKKQLRREILELPIAVKALAVPPEPKPEK